MRFSPGRGMGLTCAGWVLATPLLMAALGCQRTVNYPSALGPRYAGGLPRVPGGAPAPQDIRLVTFNIQFGRHLDGVIELLRLAGSTDGPDIVTLQEVDDQQIGRIAHALQMSYVYYPTVVHPKTGRNYGNAVLSRWPIIEDRKLVLPHRGRWRDAQRAATGATIVVGGDTVRVYSVHLST
ncbi:MAG: endonuclease/exonuclease/phosphatase family protein, partial [Gemmatimonadetes bacterium]|nr:endonuclease/exonuclease/phosphatase family protein [Gemmatimonadota bacterium]